MTSFDESSVNHRFIQLEDVKLHVVEAGEGPPVVLLHGFPDFWRTWRFQIPALVEAGYSVIVPDMRGYHTSGKPHGISSYRIEALAADIHELMRVYGHSKISLVGHDWGGAVAWGFAALYPRALESLTILNCPHPLTLGKALQTPAQLKKSWYMLFFQLPILPELLLKTSLSAKIKDLYATLPQPSKHTSYDITRHIEALAQPGCIHSALNYYRAAVRYPFKAIYQRITCPVSVLWGKRDEHLLPRLAKPSKRVVPNATVEYFENAGHWVHWDASDEVNDALIHLLDQQRQAPEVASA